jgi:iron complex outermembrane receptor protein
VVTGENEFNFFISNSANTSMWENSPTEADAGTLKFDQTTFALDLFGTVGKAFVAAGFEYREDGYQIGAGEPASYISGGELLRGRSPTGAAVRRRPVSRSSPASSRSTK